MFQKHSVNLFLYLDNDCLERYYLYKNKLKKQFIIVLMTTEKFSRVFCAIVMFTFNTFE